MLLCTDCLELRRVWWPNVVEICYDCGQDCFRGGKLGNQEPSAAEWFEVHKRLLNNFCLLVGSGCCLKGRGLAGTFLRCPNNWQGPTKENETIGFKTPLQIWSEYFSFAHLGNAFRRNANGSNQFTTCKEPSPASIIYLTADEAKLGRHLVRGGHPVRGHLIRGYPIGGCPMTITVTEIAASLFLKFRRAADPTPFPCLFASGARCQTVLTCKERIVLSLPRLRFEH